MRAFLRTTFTSEGGTRIPVALLLAPGFVVGVTFGLAKVVRDCSLTCNVGYELAPLGMLAIAVAVLPVGALRVRLEQRWGFRRWNARSALAVAAVFIAFWSATHGLLHGRDLHPGDPSWSGALRWTYLLFFVWVGVAGAILGPNVKGTIYLAVVPERRSALLALSAAAFVAGGLTGSFLAGVITRAVGSSLPWGYERVRDTLLLAMAIVLLAWIPIVGAIARGRDRVGRLADPSPQRVARRPLALSSAAALIWRDPTLRRMAAVFVASGVAEAGLTYLFYWVITTETSGASGRSGLFADFYVLLHAASLGLMVFGTRRLLDGIGLVASLATLPVAVALGTGWLAFQGGLVAVWILRIAEKSLGDAIYEPALDRYLLDIDDEAAGTVRPFLQTVALLGGRGIGAIAVYAVATGLAISLDTYLAIFLAWVAAWLFIVVAAARHSRSG